jgi:sugar phosphate isomerase/epimerase
MVFGAPGNRRRGALAADAALDAAVDFFRPLAARVADLGTCLSIEANSPAYGCDFLTSTAEAAEFVRRVDHLGVRLQLDTSTMAMNGEDYAREITSGLPIAGHVHASEPHLVPLGQGGTDHATAARALRDGAYDGWVSIEMRAVPGDDNLASVAAAIDLARATYGDDT